MHGNSGANGVGGLVINKPKINALCPPSPLKQNLPPNMLNFNVIYSQNSRSNHGTPLPLRNLKSPLVAS